MVSPILDGAAGVQHFGNQSSLSLVLFSLPGLLVPSDVLSCLSYCFSQTGDIYFLGAAPKSVDIRELLSEVVVAPISELEKGTLRVRERSVCGSIYSVVGMFATLVLD